MSQRWKPSVTVAAVVARGAGASAQFLLIEEHTPEGLRLNNPAGHLEPGESPQEGVMREALEESGRRFTPECVVGIYLTRFSRPGRQEDVTYVRIAFGGSAGEREPDRPLDHGIVGTCWMTLAELRGCRPRHRTPLVLRCIEDYAAGRRFPLDLLQSDPSIYAPGGREG